MEVNLNKILPAKRWKVLRLLTRVQDFPKFMPNVKSCEIVEKTPEGTVTFWKTDIDQIPLSWKQRDRLDVKNFTMRFEAFEGDLEAFRGEWVLLDHPSGGTEIQLHITAHIGIPLVEKIIGELFAEKIRKNFELMINSMNERLTLLRYKNIGHRKVSDLKGFSVIGHPYNLQHLIRYFKFFKPDFKTPSREFLGKIFEMTPAYRSYDITGFKSKSGKEAQGYFIMCPIVPDMLAISPDKVIQKVIEACKVSEQLGVGIVTLGGFTSIAGEQYNKVLLNSVHVPLTTGNTFTTAMVLEGVNKAARLMDVDLNKAKAAVIGGTGDIGSGCARVLAGQVADLTITGRNEKVLMETERSLSYIGHAKVHSTRENNEAVKGADVIICAASAANSIVDFNNFKSGAVICDVGYPKNISYTNCNRRDFLIFSGGLCQTPSEFDLGFDIGLPMNKVLYGCFAEAILLDFEERYENFSWGRGNITKERVDLISGIAHKHGFDLAPFFWGDKLVTEKEIEEIRNNVRAASHS